jgi:hypothetical protein
MSLLDSSFDYFFCGWLVDIGCCSVFAQGPFNTFTINHPNRNLQFSGLTFSPDGKMLLLNTREMFLGLMDSFTGAIVRICCSFLTFMR